MRFFTSLFLAILLCTGPRASAGNGLVFISARTSGDGAAIHAYEFDAELGRLNFLDRTTEVKNPSYLAISPNHRFLYVTEAKAFDAKRDDTLAAFAIEGRTGKLKYLNEQSSQGKGACYISVDASNHVILVANYGSGSVASLPVLEDGSLGPAAAVMQHPKSDAEPHAHCVESSADNRFVFVADLGLDKVMCYRLNAPEALLTVNSEQPFISLAAGSGPRQVAIHPRRDFVYVITENKNTIDTFSYARGSGVLKSLQTISTLPAGFRGSSYCAGVKVSPDGRFLYGSNRGHNSIAAYRIGEDGTLTLVGIQPSLGRRPQDLLITPDSRWLLCANEGGNNVAVFKIDPADGSLTAAGDPVSMPAPSCIRFLP